MIEYQNSVIVGENIGFELTIGLTEESISSFVLSKCSHRVQYDCQWGEEKEHRPQKRVFPVGNHAKGQNRYD